MSDFVVKYFLRSHQFKIFVNSAELCIFTLILFSKNLSGYSWKSQNQWYCIQVFNMKTWNWHENGKSIYRSKSFLLSKNIISFSIANSEMPEVVLLRMVQISKAINQKLLSPLKFGPFLMKPVLTFIN